MPTKTRTVGDKTWYDKTGRLDEDLPEEPGYSDKGKGCGQAVLVAVCLILIIV